jgi:DegV family protein with EDD domain
VTRIKIVSDSTADIPPELARELGIDIIPARIKFGDQSFRAGSELSNEQYYQIMADGRLRPRFLPPHTDDIDKLFRRLTLQYDHIFSLHMPAQLTSIFRSVQSMHNRIPATATKIRVIDSKSFSAGLGMIVTQAAQAVQDGASPQEVEQLITDSIGQTHFVFFVDTIDMLEQAGCLEHSNQSLNSLQRIKPLLLLDDGDIVLYERTRTRTKAIEGLATFVEDFPQVQGVTILYTSSLEDVEKFLERVEPVFPREQVSILQMGASSAAMLGPGAMGVAVYEGLV